jgi:hypothetical protein
MSYSSAVAYQKSRGLYVDGVVGGETWDKMMTFDTTVCSWALNEKMYDEHLIKGEKCGAYVIRGSWTNDVSVLKKDNYNWIRVSTAGPS